MIEYNDENIVVTFPESTQELKSLARGWFEQRFRATPSMAMLDQEKVWESKFARAVPDFNVTLRCARTIRQSDNNSSKYRNIDLGYSALYRVNEFLQTPKKCHRNDGVMLPHFDNEAIEVEVGSKRECSAPIALRVYAGVKCAVSGEVRSSQFTWNPRNYLVHHSQPMVGPRTVRIRGIRESEHFVRQFVADQQEEDEMLRYKGDTGGSANNIEIVASPVAVGKYWPFLKGSLEYLWNNLMEDVESVVSGAVTIAIDSRAAGTRLLLPTEFAMYGPDAWDETKTVCCSIHLCRASEWRRLTGLKAPVFTPQSGFFRRTLFRDLVVKEINALKLM